MKTNALLIGMFVSALAGACSDRNSDTPEGAGGAAGDGSRAETGGKPGDDPKASAGESGEDKESTGGRPGSDDETGGSPGAAGDRGTTGGDDEPQSGSAGAGGAADDGAAGAGPDGSAGEPGDGGDTYGFSIRAPKEKEVTCSENPMGSTDPAVLMDEDYVCRFGDGPIQGYVYVQATPTDCRMLMGAVPTSFDAAGWSSVDGDLSELDGLFYDHGGNHFNNTIEFDHGDRHYRIAHSSIGFGGRSCQPPDCLQVFEEGGSTLVDDGCTKDRTLAVTCVAIEAEGVVPLLEDTFEPCPGDPNYDS